MKVVEEHYIDDAGKKQVKLHHRQISKERFLNIAKFYPASANENLFTFYTNRNGSNTAQTDANIKAAFDNAESISVVVPPGGINPGVLNPSASSHFADLLKETKKKEEEERAAREEAARLFALVQNNLKKVAIQSLMNSVDDQAFQTIQNNLKNVALTSLMNSVDDKAFQTIQNNLKKVALTSLMNSVDDQAFQNIQNNLKKVALTSLMNSVDDQAFQNIQNNLKNVALTSLMNSVDEQTFQTIQNNLKNVGIQSLMNSMDDQTFQQIQNNLKNAALTSLMTSVDDQAFQTIQNNLKKVGIQSLMNSVDDQAFQKIQNNLKNAALTSLMTSVDDQASLVVQNNLKKVGIQSVLNSIDDNLPSMTPNPTVDDDNNKVVVNIDGSEGADGSLTIPEIGKDANIDATDIQATNEHKKTDENNNLIDEVGADIAAVEAEKVKQSLVAANALLQTEQTTSSHPTANENAKNVTKSNPNTKSLLLNLVQSRQVGSDRLHENQINESERAGPEAVGKAGTMDPPERAGLVVAPEASGIAPAVGTSVEIGAVDNVKAVRANTVGTDGNESDTDDEKEFPLLKTKLIKMGEQNRQHTNNDEEHDNNNNVEIIVDSHNSDVDPTFDMRELQKVDESAATNNNVSQVSIDIPVAKKQDQETRSRGAVITTDNMDEQEQARLAAEEVKAEEEAQEQARLAAEDTDVKVGLPTSYQASASAPASEKLREVQEMVAEHERKLELALPSAAASTQPAPSASSQGNNQKNNYQDGEKDLKEQLKTATSNEDDYLNAGDNYSVGVEELELEKFGKKRTPVGNTRKRVELYRASLAKKKAAEAEAADTKEADTKEADKKAETQETPQAAQANTDMIKAVGEKSKTLSTKPYINPYHNTPWNPKDGGSRPFTRKKKKPKKKSKSKRKKTRKKHIKSNT